MSSARDEARAHLDAHGRAIDDLHQKLAAAPGVDKDRLNKAFEKFRAAHAVLADDALGCMN